jgi:Ca2+-binding RTX toxin-like protein
MSDLFGTYTWLTRRGFNDGIADTLRGGSHDDVIRGYGGDDHLYGNGGHDEIYGGRGDDWIRGGTGWDTLTGGSGRDTFEFFKGDSGASWSKADVITDFNTNDDTILFQTSSPKGSNSNYAEFLWTGPDLGNDKANYNEMMQLAQEEINDNHKIQFVFGTNGTDGYLFADLDHNGSIDTGIELKGLNSTGDFSHLNIF